MSYLCLVDWPCSEFYISNKVNRSALLRVIKIPVIVQKHCHYIVSILMDCLLTRLYFEIYSLSFGFYI
jgi:hypothetical protein